MSRLSLNVNLLIGGIGGESNVSGGEFDEIGGEFDGIGGASCDVIDSQPARLVTTA